MYLPEEYEPRPNNNVTAIQYDGTEDSILGLQTWLQSFLTEEEDPAVWYQTPMGVLVLHWGNLDMQVSFGQVVYLDEDGFHAVGSGSYEMKYRKVVQPTSGE